MNHHPPRCSVIGFGPGLGHAIARRFAGEGFAVLGLARDPARHAALAAERITLAAADAGDPDSLAAALADGTDVLVYNAYRATMAAPSEIDPAALVADFRVNVAGALAAVQSVLPRMRAQGRGSLIFTGGGLALDPTGWLPAASLAIGKAGLRSLAQTLHAELAPLGIHAGTVTVAGAVAPGTAFDPDRIAEAFLDLHRDPPGAFRAEIIFRG
ncbi:SDR family NAD(P)-dependent oxidoreductase [Roseomonas sp. PWR1]|uniref:SDR family NAD(P)-dependent oxidoreductase n=1 Tax=Roseomonas nitratireducens TaxID=2820810 RepID=A0ABS4AYR0_9PROT|nr:SDR family NAD(P)-dependent oxidoreductase [Neoroseomonas nitratireducens]MBP0466517.1 SDR family NAD(P)-dependent oxidoreductase [Neoroseomonas nitratireducens]